MLCHPFKEARFFRHQPSSAYSSSSSSTRFGEAEWNILFFFSLLLFYRPYKRIVTLFLTQFFSDSEI